MLRLYDFPLSSNAHKVRNLLSILDLEYERIRVDLLAGDQRSVEFRAINPFAQVPVLIDADEVVRDSSAILVYLGRKFGRGRWLPVDASGEARVAQWLATASTVVANGPGRARLIELFGGAGDLREAQTLSLRVLDVYEAHLANTAYLVGNAPTIADIASYTDLALAPDGGIDLSIYPCVLRWLERLHRIQGFEPAPTTRRPRPVHGSDRDS